LLASAHGDDYNFFSDDAIAKEMQFDIEMFGPWTKLLHGCDLKGSSTAVVLKFLQWTFGVADLIGKFSSFISFSNSIIGIASLCLG
jgi:hypothetical protein